MWIKTETVCKLLLTEHIKCWNWDILLRFFNRRAKGWKSYVTFKNTWCNMSQQVSLISNTIRQKKSFPEAESFRGWGFTMLWKTVWVSSTNTSFLDLVGIIKIWNSVLKIMHVTSSSTESAFLLYDTYRFRSATCCHPDVVLSVGHGFTELSGTTLKYILH